MSFELVALTAISHPKHTYGLSPQNTNLYKKFVLAINLARAHKTRPQLAMEPLLGFAGAAGRAGTAGSHLAARFAIATDGDGRFMGCHNITAGSTQTTNARQGRRRYLQGSSRPTSGRTTF